MEKILAKMEKVTMKKILAKMEKIIVSLHSNGCNLSRVRVRRTRDTGYRVAQDA